MRRLGALGGLVLATLAAVLAVRVATEDSRPDPAPPQTATKAPSELPSATEASSAESLDEQLARVADVVAEVRELAFERVPEPTTLSAADLSRRVRDELASYSDEQAQLDARMLAALGAIPRGTDVKELLVDAYASQVAGFYDPEHQELVVAARTDGERLGRIAEITLAHELVHALTDQVLGLPSLEGEGLDDDQALARQSLVEGDATLAMQRYATEGMSIVDQLLLATESLDLASELGNLQDLPHVLERTLTFPYLEGLTFVGELHRRGGWNAVNRAYEQPPGTSVEILFPERYPLQDRPDAPDTSPPGTGWQQAQTTSFGAADLLLLFEAPGGEVSRALPDPRVSVAPWRAGRLELWTSREQTALGVGLLGDESGRLCADVISWYAASFPDAERAGDPSQSVFDGTHQDAVVRCAGETITIGIAPDVEAATAVAA